MAYTQRKTLLDAASSDVTGGPFFIGDCTQLSLSWTTQVAGASTLTVQMSNEDGLGSAFGDAAWSNVTLIAAQGMFGVETGPRWLRVLRASASSASVEITGLVNR